MDTITTLGLLAIEKSSELISNITKLIQFKAEPNLSHEELFEELKKRHVFTSPEYVSIANEVSVSFYQLQSVMDMITAHGDIPQHVNMKIDGRIFQELKNLAENQDVTKYYDTDSVKVNDYIATDRYPYDKKIMFINDKEDKFRITASYDNSIIDIINGLVIGDNHRKMFSLYEGHKINPTGELGDFVELFIVDDYSHITVGKIAVISESAGYKIIGLNINMENFPWLTYDELTGIMKPYISKNIKFND